jgi:hypothetical protein
VYSGVLHTLRSRFDEHENQRQWETRNAATASSTLELKELQERDLSATTWRTLQSYFDPIWSSLRASSSLLTKSTILGVSVVEAVATLIQLVESYVKDASLSNSIKGWIPLWKHVD